MFEKKGPQRGESPKAQLLRKKKQDIKKKKALFYSIVGIIFLGLIVGFFWLPFIRIKQITISPVLTLEAKDVEAFVNERISHRVFGILPGKNIFLINKKRLITALKKEYSVIDTVVIDKEFTTITVTITERSPKTIWCASELPNTPCYFIHEDGTIFEEAGAFSNPLFFVFYTPLESAGDPLGSTVLPKDKFERVINIQKTLATYGIKLYGYKKDTEGTESFFLTPIILGGATPAFIKSQEWQSGETFNSKFITALKNSKLKESQAERFKGLDYIDVRFNDQISFKLK